MTLQRCLEPELMDTSDEARDYDSMDHSAVNRLFVDDLLQGDETAGDILDLGTGTAQIPIELCGRGGDFRVMATDAAMHMLELARYNIEAAGMTDRIQLALVDAKQLPYPDRTFDVVMSNSIVHHIPDPSHVLREALRVVRPGGLLFFRDLFRPADEQTLTQLVDTYAADCSAEQRQLFAQSLHAALSLPEIRDLVEQLGFNPETVQATSDRHWTWRATAK
jgi:ubiquinone/menaquinone biosynthesis C-methylase UbiE